MKKDVIIILAGGINPDGSLSEIPKYRIDKGIELFKKGIAPYIIMSGSLGFQESYSPPKTEAEAMKEYAISLGVPERNILIEEESKDTIGNAYFTKINFLEPRNWKDIVVVTSDYHIERTKYIFKKVLGPEYKIKFIEIPSRLSQSEFDKKVRREQRVLFLLRQWMGPIEDGDDAGIKKLLYTKHPGYAENPEISKEQLAKMIEG